MVVAFKRLTGRCGIRVPTYGRIAWTIIAVGSVARVAALVHSWGRPLGPDSAEYLLLSRRYSFTDPWSASYREPLWRGLVKLSTAPFGYSPDAYRCFTTLISILTLPVAWIMLKRLVARRALGERVAVLALAVIAFSVHLIRLAPQGWREDLCLLLALPVLFGLLGGENGRRASVIAGSAIGLLSVIRFELATLLVIISALFALLRRAGWLAPALGGVLIVVLSGPWLWANKERHGSLTYNTQVHATYYWKHEVRGKALAELASPPGVDPPVRLTWSQYYLDYLGPAITAERAATGYPRVLAKTAAAQLLPRDAAVTALGRDQRSVGWLLSILAITVGLCAGLLTAGRRVIRRHGLEPTFLTALALLLLSAAPYAALSALVDIRVLSFTVPLLAVLVGIGVDACLPERTVSPLRREASAVSIRSGSLA